MVRLEWLVSHGEARGRYYTAGPRIDVVRQQAGQTTTPYTEPYRRRKT
jgi:hypothetical protein